MIVFKLICKDCEISFNSWFSSSIEYEKLKKQKFISCHSCNSLNIEKTLMSPSVFRSKNTPKIDHLDLKYKEIKKIILDNQNYVKKNLNYVGENFAYEARSIHYNDKKKKKGIYGTASKKDLKELSEEGIDAQMLPWVEDKSN